MSAKRFRIALSFAGEKRYFVAKVAAILAKQFGEDRILYDKFHEAEFAHANLAFSLPELYCKKTDLIVAVFCRNYDKKEWCGLEWRAIFALVKKGKEKPVMLTRFGRVDGKGLHGLAGFIELDHKIPEQAAALILERLALNEGKPKDHYTKPAASSGKALASSIPHNLPHLPFFYGRTEELRKIADALSPKTRTWGALVDGPGGIGKTSLAIRAALEAAEGLFRQILFVSSKSRKLTADGEVRVTDFVVPGYIEMLNEIARMLKQPHRPKAPETERARLVIEALKPAQALLILDNLESLPKDDQNRLFDFLSQLPQGCKAIVTSRRRTDQDARIIRLAKLEQDAALALLAELEEDRPLLKKASLENRIHLYEETGGNPLLIRWVAGQLGRGHCRTIAAALAFLRSTPVGNDPLEFIFGDLLDTFTEAETKVLAALTYFTQAVETKLIAELAGVTETAAGTALGDLASRSLVIPDEEEQHFVLVAMAAAFLRNARPEMVKETGDRLEKDAFALIIENGGKKYSNFPMLDTAWPKISSALPLFVAGSNERLQEVCSGLRFFLEFTGRWEEWRSVIEHAEEKALAAGDYQNAGKRAYQLGWIFYRYVRPDQILACADRAGKHWRIAARKDPSSKDSIRNQACALRLHGLGHRRAKKYGEALTALRKSLALFKRLPDESTDLVIALNDIATTERHAGRLDKSERYLRTALEIARRIRDEEGVASYTSGFAILAIKRKDWVLAEELARDALPLSEKVGRVELVARACHRLAMALQHQGKASEALSHALRAVDIFTRLRSPALAKARDTVAECRAALLNGLDAGWIYNTTTLAGNTLTLAEVAKALTDPKTKIAKRPAEHLAATRAQDAAIKALGNWLGEDRDFTKDDLFFLHTVLMQGSTVDSMKPVGTWKIKDNGTPIVPDGKSRWNDNHAAPHHTGALMEVWLAEFNKRREGAGDAFWEHVWLHATFARIRPFADGNGRMARLLANVPLVAGGHPVVEIPATARDRYLAALARWQFACGAPRPNTPLITKEGELKDFIALCKASQTTTKSFRKPAPRIKVGAPIRKPPRSRKKS